MSERIHTIEPVYVETMPEPLDPGKLYISHKYELAIHLCACGCGGKAVTPIGKKDNGWTLSENGAEVSLNPSIGNWSGEKPYHAHYYITSNKIVWCND